MCKPLPNIHHGYFAMNAIKVPLIVSPPCNITQSMVRDVQIQINVQCQLLLLFCSLELNRCKIN